MSDNAPSYGIILSNRGPVLDYCTPSDLIDLGVYSEESGVFDTVWAGDAFLTNPRLSMMVRIFDKMKIERKNYILNEAEKFINKNTYVK